MPGVSLNTLYEALGSPLGVVIACDAGTTPQVRQKLYNLRKESGDQDLDCLSFVQSPSNPSHLWIVKVVK